MSDQPRYGAIDALRVAFPEVPPMPKANPGYFNTSRSGLCVNFSAPHAPYRKEDFHQMEVSLNGPVDKHDAIQLAEFFSTLASELEAL